MGKLPTLDKTVMRRVGDYKRTRLSNDGAQIDRTANRSAAVYCPERSTWSAISDFRFRG